MRVLICGSRTFTDRITMFRTMSDLTKKYGAENLTLIHGAAPGADRMADAIAKQFGWSLVVPFPANWDLHGKRAGYVRNKQMLVEGQPNLVIGFKDKPVSVGTDMMLKLATDSDSCEVETVLVEPVPA